MQAPTHMIAGVLIQKVTQRIPDQRISVTICAVAGILSHGILDRFARFTYHPPQPLWHDWFWIAYHSMIVLTSTFIIITYWHEYKTGMFWALLPDLDWLLLRPLSLFAENAPVGDGSILHPLVYRIVDITPLLTSLTMAPADQFARAGAFPEFLLMAWLLVNSVLRRRTVHIQNKTIITLTLVGWCIQRVLCNCHHFGSNIT